MMSILFDVSEGISAENCIGSIWTWNPASLPTSVMRSTITPWMLLVLVSRNVKGTPVGVEPTLSTCCADTGAAAVKTRAAMAACKRRLKGIVPSLEVWAPAGVVDLQREFFGFAAQAHFHDHEWPHRQLSCKRISCRRRT